MTSQNNHPLLKLESNTSYSWCNYSAKIDRIRYLWIVDNFSFFEAKGKVLKSPIFTSSTNTECKCYLSLKLNPSTRDFDDESFIDDDTSNSFALFLYMTSSGTSEKVYLKFDLSILNEDYDKEITKKFGVNEMRTGIGRGKHTFFTKNELIDENLLPNDRLRILCEAEFSLADFSSVSSDKCSFNPVLPNMDQFSVTNDLEVLLKNRLFTDVTLSVNGQDYPAHKIILAARSPVFEAMFRNNMAESGSNRVEIIDIDGKVMKELLNYIYTGKSENVEELAEQLFVAAEKYDLKGLKIICEHQLLKNLSAENAANSLLLADVYNANEMKSKVVNFIVDKCTKVTSTETWKSIALANPQLTVEVCDALSRRLACA